MKRFNVLKSIPIVLAVAAVAIIYAVSFGNDEIMLAAKNAGVTVVERTKTDGKYSVVISTGSVSPKKEDAVLIRHAKTAFEEAGLFGTEIVLKTSDGKIAAKTVAEEENGEKPELYMEEELLEFRLEYGISGVKSVKVTSYPQCYTDASPDCNGRTVNLELSETMTSDEIFTLFDSLNEKGAAVCVCNVAVTDDSGNILELYSADVVKKDVITVNYDTDK